MRIGWAMTHALFTCAMCANISGCAVSPEPQPVGVTTEIGAELRRQSELVRGCASMNSRSICDRGGCDQVAFRHQNRFVNCRRAAD